MAGGQVVSIHQQAARRGGGVCSCGTSRREEAFIQCRTRVQTHTSSAPISCSRYNQLWQCYASGCRLSQCCVTRWNVITGLFALATSTWLWRDLVQGTIVWQTRWITVQWIAYYSVSFLSCFSAYLKRTVYKRNYFQWIRGWIVNSVPLLLSSKPYLRWSDSFPTN